MGVSQAMSCARLCSPTIVMDGFQGRTGSCTGQVTAVLPGLRKTPGYRLVWATGRLLPVSVSAIHLRDGRPAPPVSFSGLATAVQRGRHSHHFRSTSASSMARDSTANEALYFLDCRCIF